MDQKGLLGSLFDFTFDEFVTTKIIRFFYGLLLALVALGAVVGILGALAMMFGGSFMMGLGLLVVVPVVALIYLIMARAATEMIIVVFRIAENTRMLVKLRQEEGRGAPTPEIRPGMTA